MYFFLFNGERFQRADGETRSHRVGSEENPEVKFGKMNIGEEYETQFITCNLTSGHSYTFKRNGFDVDLF